MILPKAADGGALFVRIDYADERSWRRCFAAATARYSLDDFERTGTLLTPVSSSDLDGMSIDTIAQLPREGPLDYVLVADVRTMTDQTIVVVDLNPQNQRVGRTFRCAPEQIERFVGDLAVAHRTFADFADTVGKDGEVFRGLPEHFVEQEVASAPAYDAPTREDFARFSGVDGTWNGPGHVVRADYHHFYLCGPAQRRVEWQFDRLVEVDSVGDMVLTTICAAGPVAVQLELLPARPTERPQGWESVQQITIPVFTGLVLESFDGSPSHPFEVPTGDHALRVLRATWDAEWDSAADRIRELYVLQLWPLGSTAVTDATLAKIEQDDADATQAEQHKIAAHHEAVLRNVTEEFRRSQWAGREPSPQLEALGEHAATVSRADWMLAETVATLAPEQQRRLAAWTVEVAFEDVDSRGLDLQEALGAIRNGRPLPAPFDDQAALWERFLPGPERLVVSVRPNDSAGVHQVAAVAPAAAAVAALLRAGDWQHPGAAVMGALAETASGQQDQARFWDRVRDLWTVHDG